MTDKLFDNFVRDRLENYPSPIPEGLWEKIADEKNKRPKAFWWQNNGGWYAGMGVIALMSGAYFLLNNLKEKKAFKLIKNQSQIFFLKIQFNFI